jgi:hypothetical protein
MDDANYLKAVDKVNVNICRFERSNSETCGTQRFFFARVTTVSSHCCNVMSTRYFGTYCCVFQRVFGGS